MKKIFLVTVLLMSQMAQASISTSIVASMASNGMRGKEVVQLVQDDIMTFKMTGAQSELLKAVVKDFAEQQNATPEQVFQELLK